MSAKSPANQLAYRKTLASSPAAPDRSIASPIGLTRGAARFDACGALALRRRLGVGLDVDVLLALGAALDLDDVVVPRDRVERDASEMRDGVAVDEHAAPVPRLDADDAEKLKADEEFNIEKLRMVEAEKQKKLAGMYGDKKKVTRGDVIMAAKKKGVNPALFATGGLSIVFMAIRALCSRSRSWSSFV